MPEPPCCPAHAPYLDRPDCSWDEGRGMVCDCGRPQDSKPMRATCPDPCHDAPPQPALEVAGASVAPLSERVPDTLRRTVPQDSGAEVAQIGTTFLSTERLLSETHKAIDATIRWHGMIGHPKSESAEKVYLHYRNVVDRMVNALAEQAPGTLPAQPAPGGFEEALTKLFECIHEYARAGGYITTLHPNDYRREMEAVRAAHLTELAEAEMRGMRFPYGDGDERRQHYEKLRKL